MPASPKTRNSLILRLRDREDAESWREFVRIYEPVIYRVAVSRGMQHADALELVQRVLLAVAKAIDRFEPDSKRARFRTWLYKITHNEFCRQYAASQKNLATGDSAVHQLLTEVSDREDEDFSREYRHAVFRWAADQVRPNVKDRTWQAFWQTSVENQPVELVASGLGLSVGAVYIARSRVMARLQAAVKRFEEQP